MGINLINKSKRKIVNELCRLPNVDLDMNDEQYYRSFYNLEITEPCFEFLKIYFV